MESASPPLQVFELVGVLARHNVDYVLIGGVALQAHGHVRTTQDLDVIAAWTPENMRQLADALRDLQARLRGVDADLLGLDLTDPQQLYDGGNFLMHTRHGDLDVFALDQTSGAPRSYQQLRARAVPLQIRGLTLLVAHPEDLIRMKTAAASFRDRPEPKRRQDLDDIAVLEQLRATKDPEHPPAAAPGQPHQAPGPPAQERIARERVEREARRLEALRTQAPGKQPTSPPPPPPTGQQGPSTPQEPTWRRGGPTIGR